MARIKSPLNNTKVDYDRIFCLADKRGVAVKHLCDKIGRSHTYLYVQRRQNALLPEQTVFELADLLSTTADYLRGMTDDDDPHYLVKEAGSKHERLLSLVMEKLPELSDTQTDALLSLFSAPKAQFDTVIATVALLKK